MSKWPAIGMSVAAFALILDETITYTYDVHGRLVQAVHSGTVNNGRDSDYVYDRADNRTEFERTQPLNQAAAAPGRGDASSDEALGAGSGDPDLQPVERPGNGPAAGSPDALFDG